MSTLTVCQNEIHFGTIGPRWHFAPHLGSDWVGRCGRPASGRRYCPECTESIAHDQGIRSYDLRRMAALNPFLSHVERGELLMPADVETWTHALVQMGTAISVVPIDKVEQGMAKVAAPRGAHKDYLDGPTVRLATAREVDSWEQLMEQGAALRGARTKAARAEVAERYRLPLPLVAVAS